jgi:hypothetical protein
MRGTDDRFTVTAQFRPEIVHYNEQNVGLLQGQVFLTLSCAGNQQQQKTNRIPHLQII